jgi:nucleoid DNA-binding protein
MNFTDLTEEVAEEFGLTKDLSRKIITFLVKKLREKLVFGMNVSFRHIGSFKLRVRHPKMFMNLQTGQKQMSKKCYYLDFKATPNMEGRLKEKTVY